MGRVTNRRGSRKRLTRASARRRRHGCGRPGSSVTHTGGPSTELEQELPSPARVFMPRCSRGVISGRRSASIAATARPTHCSAQARVDCGGADRKNANRTAWADAEASTLSAASASRNSARAAVTRQCRVQIFRARHGRSVALMWRRRIAAVERKSPCNWPATRLLAISASDRLERVSDAAPGKAGRPCFFAPCRCGRRCRFAEAEDRALLRVVLRP